jgi:methionyl-tRNA formyltransferase
MKILYWGTPEYAVPTLLALHAAGHEIVGVVTQPDRRRGRGKQLMPSAIKVCAQSLDLLSLPQKESRLTLAVKKNLPISMQTYQLLWHLDKSFRNQSLNNHHSVAGMAMAHFCHVGEVPVQFSGPCWRGILKQE